MPTHLFDWYTVASHRVIVPTEEKEKNSLLFYLCQKNDLIVNIIKFIFSIVIGENNPLKYKILPLKM